MQTYRLTDEEFRQIFAASQPVPYMVIGGVEPTSPRENAMAVWRQVAARVGCNVDTIAPSDTGNELDFQAEPLQ